MTPTFKTSLIASLQSVGTAATLAFAGVYLHRRGFVIGPDSKKTMALLSHQITIPLILFTNLVKCTPEKYNPDQCFTATDQLGSGLWILLLWPIYVMGIGFIIGLIVSTLNKTTTNDERKVVISGSSFGGAIVIPLVLASTIVKSLPPSSPILITDPSTVLAVYLIIDNTIKFVVGGLLFPRYDKDHDNDNDNDGGGEGEEQQRPRLINKVKIVLLAFCQPPVLASIAGVIVLSIPQLRGIFVNLQPENHHTMPLEWLFNGMVSIGNSTMPITMVILGINLSHAAGDIHLKVPAKIKSFFQSLRHLRDDGGRGRSTGSSSSNNNNSIVELPTTTIFNNDFARGNNDDDTDIAIHGSSTEHRISRRLIMFTVLGKMLLMPVSYSQSFFYGLL